MRSIVSAFLLVGGLALGLSACGGGADGFGGGFGANPGGVQDMRFARALVAAGKVPPKDAILVEGMYREHDFPLTGQPCSTVLCLRSAIGVAPDEAGAPRAWLQVGLSSTIDPDTYVRPSQTLVFAVDVSGSMSWDYPNETTNAAVALDLMRAFATRLGPQDRVAMITFSDEANDALSLRPANDPAFASAIENLGGSGGTNIEAGLSRAFAIAAAAPAETELVRVVLVTDAQPNIGATSPSAFEQIAAAGAAEGIGLSVFGTGLGLDASVFKSMSALRGGNAFTVMHEADVPVLMENSWPWMFSPIAHDLVLTTRPAAGFVVRDAFGFPGEPNPAEMTLQVATVFLSKSRGALLVEISSDPEEALPSTSASVRLDYTTLAGEPVHEELSSGYQGQPTDAEGRWFEQPSVAKATALALLVSRMADACDAYATDHAAAIAILEPARERFASDAAALGDPALPAELAFTDAMLDLMRNDAPQGSFYDDVQ